MGCTKLRHQFFPRVCHWRDLFSSFIFYFFGFFGCDNTNERIKIQRGGNGQLKIINILITLNEDTEGTHSAALTWSRSVNCDLQGWNNDASPSVLWTWKRHLEVECVVIHGKGALLALCFALFVELTHISTSVFTLLSMKNT